MRASAEPIDARLVIYGEPGAEPVVVQLLDGETPDDATHRYDREQAEKVRADGFGFMLCDVCDRPSYVCRRDPETHERRAAARRQAIP